MRREIVLFALAFPLMVALQRLSTLSSGVATKKGREPTLGSSSLDGRLAQALNSSAICTV
jgi:hypothetical protein